MVSFIVCKRKDDLDPASPYVPVTTPCSVEDSYFHELCIEILKKGLIVVELNTSNLK